MTQQNNTGRRKTPNKKAKVKSWQHIGTVLMGIAAIVTAGVGLYEKLHTLQNSLYKESVDSKKIKKEYGIVEDPDGWVNLRERPDVTSPSLAKILNGTNLEIVNKNGNWFEVYTESGRSGFVFKDRLKIFYYEK
jgi:hypothetical protein